MNYHKILSDIQDETFSVCLSIPTGQKLIACGLTGRQADDIVGELNRVASPAPSRLDIVNNGFLLTTRNADRLREMMARDIGDKPMSSKTDILATGGKAYDA